ncbi:unnamed protein product [Orchesella dallaii]|uniref:F-box domain-containing protein n=1 Tax=Orchesella dallaii TaxID=48710 RepID=A0ABP1RKE9_9HEXA
MSEQNLLNLPRVVQDNILSKLSIKEQLNFRLVCKGAKSWIDGNGHRLAKNIPATIMNDLKNVTFTKFVQQKEQPIHLMTKIYLENETSDLFEDNLKTKFLQLHSNPITTLRLKRYFLNGRNESQQIFLEGFSNLRHFEVEEILIASSGNTDERTKVPRNFRNLETLKLGRVIIYQETTGHIFTEDIDISPDDHDICLKYVWNLIDSCVQLMYLCVPGVTRRPIDSCYEETRILSYINVRAEAEAPLSFNSNTFIMTVDLHRFSGCIRHLPHILLCGGMLMIKFLNVNSIVFNSGFPNIMEGPRNDYIHSLVSTLIVDPPIYFVQKITITASLMPLEYIVGRQHNAPSLFPNLLEIDIILDIGFDPEVNGASYSQDPNGTDEVICIPHVDQLLRFFFPRNRVYANCHSLSIIFLDPIHRYQRRATPANLTCLPNIISCLRELRNLSISGWNGTNVETYLMLWQGFPKLQKLTIDRCPTLNPKCFIGGNGNSRNISNFQFFQELEFLELIGLEAMPDMDTESRMWSNIQERFDLEPFNLLTKNGCSPRTAVWIRRHVPDEPIVVKEFTRVTRSAVRAGTGNATTGNKRVKLN